MARKLFNDEKPKALPPSRSRPARPLTDAGKARKLGGAIVEAFKARGVVSIQDGTQAGLTRKDVERLWDDGMAQARRIEPRITDMVAS